MDVYIRKLLYFMRQVARVTEKNLIDEEAMYGLRAGARSLIIKDRRSHRDTYLCENL